MDETIKDKKVEVVSDPNSRANLLEIWTDIQEEEIRLLKKDIATLKGRTDCLLQEI